MHRDGVRDILCENKCSFSPCLSTLNPGRAKGGGCLVSGISNTLWPGELLRTQGESAISSSAFDKIKNTGVLLSHVFHLLLLFVAGILVLGAAVVEIMHVLVEGSPSLQDILMLFIFIELGAMISIYFKTNRLSVRFLVYMAITPLTRLLVFDMKSMDNATILTITGTIVMPTASVFVPRAGTHWEGADTDEAD
jgi:phosphate starvation-inducible membrane PsiE